MLIVLFKSLIPKKQEDIVLTGGGVVNKPDVGELQLSKLQHLKFTFELMIPFRV